jgi:FlaA1/EpsC-like NDP-sugar epimerase
MLLRIRFWPIVFLNVGLISASLIVAWLLRFEFNLPQRKLLFAALPLLILVRLAALARFNLLHGYWRYAGVDELADVINATAVGSIGFLVCQRWVLGVTTFPKSVYCLETLLTTAALCGARLLSRLVVQTVSRYANDGARKSVLVIGAGAAGAMLLNELPCSGYVAVGVLDDDRRKLGARIHGVPMLGSVDALPRLARRYHVGEVLIAIPSATGRQMRRITGLCEQSGTRFRTIPGMADLIAGTATVEQLRDVRIEDLLGRNPVQLDVEPVRQQLEGRVIMVTGAAGSIGSELCTQLLSYRPQKLLCVDQDESALFFLEQKLAGEGAQVATEYHVADITNRQRMRCIMAGGGVEIIFHAAAYKHVPMMENNVAEAARNNIFGLLALLDVAEQCGCIAFLMISSDKAVKPTNVMGCTKRVCELIMSARSHRLTRRVTVRFGNVLGSQGSVIPVLQEQIRKQHMVTVTHPEISRFFMTIPEAVSLVLQAFTIGRHGEILVLEMGEPMRILDLAHTLIRLCGKREDEVDIVFTGLRKGEKLHEELFYESEQALSTACDQVLRTTGKHMSWQLLQQHLVDLHGLLYAGTDAMIRAKLKQIVPEYSYADGDAHRLTLPPLAVAPSQPEIAVAASAD